MSGIAFVLSGCDFSAKNLGKVTFLEDANITGITISGSDTVNGLSSQYSVGYTPANTSQRGVTWSVISGSQYATIDASTGLLTILSGASAASVTIKATSTVNASISVTKTINVTYNDVVNILTSIDINVNSTNISGISFSPTVTYNPTNTSYKGVIWSITTGGNYATIDANTGVVTILSGANANTIDIKATSIVYNTIVATKSIVVTYSVPIINLSSKVAYVPIPSFGSNYTLYLETEDAIYTSNETTYAKYGTILSDSCSGNELVMGGASGLGVALKQNVTLTTVLNPSGKNLTSSSKSYQTFNSVVGVVGTDNTYGFLKKLFITPSTLIVNDVSKSYTPFSLSNVLSKGYLYINYMGAIDLSIYDTPESLSAARIAGTISHVMENFKIKNFIVFCNTSYSTAEECVSNRSLANIDIQLENGSVVNKGTSGNIIIG